MVQNAEPELVVAEVERMLAHLAPAHAQADTTAK
jgi:hypothetical protein